MQIQAFAELERFDGTRLMARNFRLLSLVVSDCEKTLLLGPQKVVRERSTQ